MKDHVQPAPSVIAERYKFKKCVQGEGDSVNQFCARLKAATTHCHFRGELNNNLRDQFVWGIAADTIKKKLLSEKELTFEKAVQIAVATESAIKDAAGMSPRPSAINVIREGKDHRKKNFPPSNNLSSGGGEKGKQNNGEKKCFRCNGANHAPSDCRYIGLKKLTKVYARLKRKNLNFRQRTVA